jgi:hypothetical membrane protein
VDALLALGILGATMFVVTFTIDGATRPQYSPTRHVVSALALGPRGWLQGTNFLVCGTLIVASSVGVYLAVDSPWFPLLIGVFGVSLALSGVWKMDPVRGYPPGTPDTTPSEPSRAHKLHDLAGIGVFVSLPAAAIIAAFTLDDSGWSLYSWTTGAALVLLLVTFVKTWESDSRRVGLVQRTMILVGWTWLALLCIYLM